MLHKIENELMSCTIESTGAEISSLLDKASGQEYIWQINKSVWGSSSPVLFPSIGKIKDDKVTHNGIDFAMTKHGIIRHNDKLEFSQNNASKCTFSLVSSDETLKRYPFTFTFSVVYELIDKRLIMSYEIENRDDVPMYFSCGGHTAYACPLNDETKLTDYVIEFPLTFDFMAETLGSTGLLSDRKRKIETDENLLSLSETLFNEDALIFSNIDFDWVRLRRKDEERGIIVRFTGYPHLALWSKPGADYVCVEPWLGLPDHENESTDLSKKPTYRMIEPSAMFSISIETEIE